MKSYVINLAERPERLAHMRETFGWAGIAFERFDAIGPDRVGDYELSARVRRRRDGRPWLPLEMGCLLSHCELWKRVAAGEDAFAAIFEDDILISDELGGILGGDLPSDADLVKLETFCEVVYVSRTRFSMGKGAGSFRRLLTLHEGTGAYIISRRAAAQLADAAARFDAPVDTSLFSPRMLADHGLVAYQAVPAVAIQGMFVPELRHSPAMRSDRPEVLELAPVDASKSSGSDLARRFIVRLFRQARGKRIVVPFAGRETTQELSPTA